MNVTNSNISPCQCFKMNANRIRELHPWLVYFGPSGLCNEKKKAMVFFGVVYECHQ